MMHAANPFNESAGSHTPRCPDPICRRLLDLGLGVSDYTIPGLPGDNYVGPLLRMRTCELVYTISPESDLLLVLYRRFNRTLSLRNPFADLIWFLQLACQEQYGIRRVLGLVNTEPTEDGAGLSDERLARFYARFFRTTPLRYDHNDWLQQDAGPLRERLGEVRRFASRQLPKID